MPQPRALSEEDEAEVIARYHLGMDMRRLARMFDTSPAAISRCLARHHVQARPAVRPRYGVDTQVIVELRDAGETWEAIATMVRMSPSGARKRYEADRGVSHLAE